MSPIHPTSRWQRIQQVFQQASQRSGEARAAFLQEACSGDPELRDEVRSLLAADAAAGKFIEEAIAGGSTLLEADDPLAGRRILGKYEIQERIGEGGFGAVYRGQDTVLHRQVAIKVCSSRGENIRKRFFREAEIAAGLQHPNITTLHDLGFEEGLPFLVQEFLSGEDLDEAIRRRDSLSTEQRIHVLTEIARGLEYAHGQGVLHRDIKPANIRLLKDGRVKIMDFGIARLLHEDSGLTREGEPLGTVGYLAPEQLRNEAVDARADIFAFGVLAYELLAYERPFQGESFSQVSYQVLWGTPSPLQDLWAQCPPRLAQLVADCLKKDAGTRPQSFSDLDSGEVVRETPLRRTTRVTDAAGSAYFLKRYEPGAARAGRIHRSRAPAEVEWSALESLPRLHISTPEPLVGLWTAAGDRGPSCLLMRGVDGVALDEALEAGAVSEAWLVDELASAVARLHIAGLQHRDLYAAHVFFCGDEQRPCLIDVARVRRSIGGRLSRQRRVKDLAALAYSLGPRLRAPLLMRMLRRYQAAAGLTSARSAHRRLVRRVLRKRRAIARHVPVYG